MLTQEGNGQLLCFVFERRRIMLDFNNKCMSLEDGKSTKITIPAIIGVEAFEGCTRLTELTDPEGVATIGKSVFEGIPAIIGVEAFEGCTIPEITPRWLK